MPFAVISGTGNWVPSYSFLYIVLIVGALLTAGVAMSAFSFYDDYYWGDEDFRDQLTKREIAEKKHILKEGRDAEEDFKRKH